MPTVVSYREPLSPLRAILLAFPVSLFVAAVATDVTYLRTAEIQWSNFSSWLNAGGLVFGAVVLIWAIVGTVLHLRSWRGGRLVHLGALVVMWVFGFLDALIHARDAWYSVTAAGLIFSLITAGAALVAAWTGYRGFPRKESL